MTTFQELIQSVTVKNHNEIKNFCAPLNVHFGVNNFVYFAISNTGKMTLLSSNPSWIEYYYAEKFYLSQPHFQPPQNFKSGISIPRNIPCEAYQQMSKKAQEFNVNFGLTFINKNRNGVEIIGFDTLTSSPKLDMLLINEQALLQNFIVQFKTEKKHLFQKINEVHVDVTPYYDPLYANVPITQRLTDRENFLNSIRSQKIPSLSLRDKDVLIHMLEAKTASQIALQLHLSPRTVENYIERLKNKLGCHSKFELIQKAKELDQVGCLSFN